MSDDQPAAEPADLRQALIDAAQLLRDNYTPERIPWVIPPRAYDEAVRQIEAGTAAPETIHIIQHAVRAEYWDEETTS